MRRTFLTGALLTAILLAATVYPAEPPRAIGVIDHGSRNLRQEMLIRPVTIGTKAAFQQPTTVASTPKKAHSDRKTLYWVIGITAGAALAIGLTAAAQGKSPF